jgi:AmiR/NasT family two-component response regulator
MVREEVELSAQEVRTAHALYRADDDNVDLGEEVDRDTDTIRQLERALETRLVIGQAQGIVMAHMDVDADHAIAYLKRVSMQTNRKVVDIAAEIAAARRLLHGE